MSQIQGYIVLFDAQCILCSKAVQFIIKHDPKRRFRFAALHSVKGKSLLAEHHLASKKMDSIVLIKGEKHYLKSSAVLRIALLLNKLWPLLIVFYIIPPFVRNYLYDILAKHRYRLWGKNEACLLSLEDAPERFL